MIGTLALLPLGWLRDPAERALSARLGRPVRIGAVERAGNPSLVPLLRLRDVRVAQPGWVGAGDMLVVRAAELRLPLLPLLRGVVRPRALRVSGLRLALVRDADGRANWTQADSGGGRTDWGELTVSDGRITLSDARRGMKFDGALTSAPAGLRLDAAGTHRSTPARFALRGGRVSGGAWPFRAAFRSPLAQLRLDAVAERPFGFDRFDGIVSAAGRDLERVDDVIQAGLFHTQPLSLRAKVRHDGTAWALTAVRGRIGGSDVTGRLTVTRQDGRSRIEGRLASDSFSFDDLASDAQLARGAAKRRTIGPRIIPDPKIDLAKLARTDGRLVVEARRLRTRERSILRGLSATLTLDRSRLVADPLVLPMAHGRMEGRAEIDQRAGAPPRLALSLAMIGARLEDFIDGGKVTGPLNGRIVLAGRGKTMRAALAQADGRVTLAARGGSVDRAAAELLGRNAGAAFSTLLGDEAQRTPLRCLGVRMRAARGMLRPDLLAIDTGVMRGEGRGWVRLSDEQVALTLDGRSKHPGLVRLPAPIEIGGTLSAPTIETADAGIGSAKTILRTLGAAIGNLFRKREAPAPDMNCAALIAQVSR
ncbi:hypothetical protein SAMN05192580_0954 [Sphingomonas jatrophae]|uniref:AsmA domain-containing protein n=2 Tax=Sphingomonas jatrophae TaxID=1166337 RepID=A0A1I6JWW2_9SPHN|nr:hypothetical protein SAMN05192580_0954 [Sphingomonas jatrophae]